MLCVMFGPPCLCYLMRVRMGGVVRNGCSNVFKLSAAGRNGKCCVQWLVHCVFVLSDAGRNGRCCV